MPDEAPREARALAEELTRIRQNSKFKTQKELADALHYSPPKLSMALSGYRKPTVEQVREIVTICVENPESGASGDIDANIKKCLNLREQIGRDVPSVPDELDKGPVARERRQRLVVAGVLSLLLILLVVAVVVVMTHRPQESLGPGNGPSPAAPAQTATCPAGMDDIATTRAHQCIGLVNDPTSIPPVFNLRPVLDQIAGQNAAVAADPARPPTVAIAYFLPLPDEPSSVSDELRDELAGVAVAQERANNPTSGLGDTPKIRVLVFNTGNDGQSFLPTLTQLDAQVPAVVAATGLGPGTAPTRALIDALNNRHIPVFPTRATDDVLTAAAPAPGSASPPVPADLFRILPSNHELAAAAAAVIGRDAGGSAQRVALIQPGLPSDPFNQSLAQTFAPTLGNTPQTTVLPTLFYNSAGDQPGAGTSFSNATVPALCASNPDRVYINGTGADLEQFLIALDTNSTCRGRSRPITVFAGPDGAEVLAQLRRAVATDLPPGLDRDRDNQALVQAFADGSFAFRYTALAHPRLWSLPEFTSSPGLEAAIQPLEALQVPLDTGGAITGYDSVLAAVACVRDAAAATSGSPVTPPQVVQAGHTGVTPQLPVYGATGQFIFDPTGQATGKIVPIVSVHPGGGASVAEFSPPTS